MGQKSLSWGHLEEHDQFQTVLNAKASMGLDGGVPE